MIENLKILLADFDLSSPVAHAGLEALEKIEGVELPEDYRTFFDGANGGEGFVGSHYLILWRADELAEFNRDYEVASYAPGIFLFGSTGGGEGFGFDTREKPYKVVQVPFVGMSLNDAVVVADGFTDLLIRMSKTNGALF